MACLHFTGGRFSNTVSKNLLLNQIGYSLEQLTRENSTLFFADIFSCIARCKVHS